jgi:hypothetical protein
MPFIRRDLYLKLLRDDKEWMDLLAQQRAEAFKLANEAAAAREQSLTTELNSSRSEAEKLTADLDETTELLTAALAGQDKLRDDQDLQIRTTALTHAVHLASIGGNPHVPTEAAAMETFLRGSAAVEADEIKLINSGWNSAIEYLIGNPNIPPHLTEYIESLRRED